MPPSTEHEMFQLHIPEFSYDMLQIVGLALLLGIILSTVMRWTERITPRKKKRKRDYLLRIQSQQVHILLCISGAFMMILIGRSLANALGLVGALSIIRFRTELISSKEATQIILLLIVGMACGLRLFLLATLMTGLISLLFILMGWYQTRVYKSREKTAKKMMILEPSPLNAHSETPSSPNLQ
ncbi:DUF4956 domain-containing protein [Deltaproteobacteria bacterium TL4]